MRITLLHPFTAKAIGFNEEHLYDSHSIPQVKALRIISDKFPEWNIVTEYFTGNKKIYSCFSLIKKTFYPVSNHKKYGVWKAEVSIFHYMKNVFLSPDITIINTSAHGGKYVFKLGKLLKLKDKKYFAMLGGINMDLRPALKEYYSNANLIITHTKIQKSKLLEDSFFKNLPVKVLPLGVDTNIFKPKEFNNLAINKKKLLFVGRITTLKQIEIAVNTTYVLKKDYNFLDIELNIIGPVSDLNYKQVLEQQIKELDLGSNVSFIANISQEKLVDYYQNADALLLPSKHESFGMVVTEAMACATPVFALENSGGPEEIIENGYNGYITSKKDYSAKVGEVLQDNIKLNSLSNNAIKSVKEKWSQEFTANLLLDFIEQY